MPEHEWKSSTLGGVVTQHTPDLSSGHAPDDDIETLGIRWYGKGLFVKPSKRSDIKGRCYALKPGTLIYNRLFAWKQAFGVVTDEYAHVVASVEFPQFNVDPALATPDFLSVYCSSPLFAQKAFARSEGSAALSRNRLKEEDFLLLPVVLPPLPTQSQIVEVMSSLDEALAATEDEADKLAEVLLARREALTNDESHPLVRADTAFDIKLGRQRSPQRATGPSMTKYLRSGNVGHDELRLDEVFEMDFNEKERQTYALVDGDVLVSEGSAGADAVGMPAAWHGELDPPVCFQNTLLRYRAKDGITSPEFVRHWCLWAYESGAFRDTAPPGVNILHIGSTRAKAMMIRLPNPDQQESIVAELEPLTEAVASLRQEADRLRVARSALLDALLTRKIEVLPVDAESDPADQF